MTHTIGNYRHVFKGQNFMTPDVILYGKVEHPGRSVYYELSRGTGFSGEEIFGVTVRDYMGRRFEPDPSKVLFSRADAENYIKTL